MCFWSKGKLGKINWLLFSTHIFSWFVVYSIFWMLIKSFRRHVEGGVLDGALVRMFLFFINMSLISLFQTEWKNNYFWIIMWKRNCKNALLQSIFKHLKADKKFGENESTVVGCSGIVKVKCSKCATYLCSSAELS